MWKTTHILVFILFLVDSIMANCVLNMKEDLTRNQPLIIKSHEAKWVSLTQSSKGTVDIGRDEMIRFVCPLAKNSFTAPDLKGINVVTAKCKSGKEFEINKKLYKIDSLHCNSPAEYTEVHTGQQCLGADTELVKIGFPVDNDFVTEYTVCFNKREKLALFTEATVSGDIDKAAIPIGHETWLSSNDLYGNINVDSAYKSETQISTFKKILNKDFFNNDRCYVERGKLVPNGDMLFGPEQASTAHYLNVVPQWSTCNRKNWIEVEKRIRDLAKSINKPLTVFSGTYRKMALTAKWGFSTKDMYMHYNSDSDKAIPVPLYIWKVVYEPQTQRAVAIIQINNPHLTISEVDSFVLCQDRCKNVNWLNFLDRKTIVNGYTYCCDLPDFEFGFAFKKSPFPKARGGILRDDNFRSG